MIAVTGSLGFIGSAIIWKLNSEGFNDIIAVGELKKLNKAKKRNIAHLKYRGLIDKDNFIEDLKSGAISGLEAVIHMGACSSTVEKNVEYVMQTNYEYTKQLCSMCLDRDIRFIYASSAATYGNGSNGFSDEHVMLEKYKPLNLYGESKHKFDIYAKKNAFLEKIVGLKYFNVYGPNEYHKGRMKSFVAKAYRQIKETGKVRLFKSHRKDYAHGEQKRDFIYIKDAVEMTLSFLDNKNANGIFNIGTSAARSWNELACCVFKAVGKETNIEYIDMPVDIKSRYQYYTRADMNKYKSSGLKFNPRSLNEGINDYVCNYLSFNKRLGEISSGV